MLRMKGPLWRSDTSLPACHHLFVVGGSNRLLLVWPARIRHRLQASHPSTFAPAQCIPRVNHFRVGSPIQSITIHHTILRLFTNQLVIDSGPNEMRPTEFQFFAAADPHDNADASKSASKVADDGTVRQGSSGV